MTRMTRTRPRSLRFANKNSLKHGGRRSPARSYAGRRAAGRGGMHRRAASRSESARPGSSPGLTPDSPAHAHSRGRTDGRDLRPGRVRRRADTPLWGRAAAAGAARHGRRGRLPAAGAPVSARRGAGRRGRAPDGGDDGGDGGGGVKPVRRSVAAAAAGGGGVGADRPRGEGEALRARAS